ncbi:MAG: OsmC family peroxiredoxin [Betaproteobacteria bacterium HGW-Betaproteobacteria-12]|nr:MAG: OsmC family peroxiredoxin [Betaproteobacteria bacterium HGW-Betaproteobacteria-12]
MKRTASAAWSGELHYGQGRLSTQSASLSQLPFAYASRFGEQPGSNPEELIAAALVNCFTMAVAALLDKETMTAESLHTRATVTLDRVDNGFAITALHLDLVADIPVGDPAAFGRIAEIARAECPVSRLLTIKPTLTARLASPDTRRTVSPPAPGRSDAVATP